MWTISPFGHPVTVRDLSNGVQSALNDIVDKLIVVGLEIPAQRSRYMFLNVPRECRKSLSLQVGHY